MAAATPSVLLTATLDDQNGNAVLKGQLIITLCGYGLELPKIVGTAMLAKVGPVEYTLPDGTADTGIKLWGNDQITPPGTFYTVAVVDDKKNVVQCNIYEFIGEGTVDLSSAMPIIPSAGGAITPPLQFATYDVWLIDQTQTGQVPFTYAQVIAFCNANGIAVPPGFTSLPPGAHFNGAPPGSVYTLTRSTYNNALIALLYNGNMLLPGIHFTFNLRTITLPFQTYNGENLYAIYVASTLS